MSDSIVRILQVGDIHYPDAVRDRPAVDIKRDPFDIREEYAPQGLRLQRITQHLTKYEPGYFNAVTFMGDFTTGSPNTTSQFASLQECVQYIHENILNLLLGKYAIPHSLFVPGNHDVDRTKCPSNQSNRLSKFDEYRAAFGAKGHSNTSVDKPTRIELSSGSTGVTLFGINTCIGCGEYLSYPDELQKDFSDQLKDIVKSSKKEAVDKLIVKYLELSETLDAPLIQADVLADLDAALSDHAHNQPNNVPVVVGHHNLLPQSQLRVALFSELMNSGQLRSSLSAKDRPICYLHGHIHTDPIEVIYNQEHPNGFIVSISAPEYSDGYNIVEFHFDDASAPLGVIVRPIVQDKQGNIKDSEPRRITFRQGPHQVSALTPAAREIFYNTFAKNEQRHFTDLTKEYSSLTPETVMKAVMELEWLRLVIIHNRQRGSEKWNVASAL